MAAPDEADKWAARVEGRGENKTEREKKKGDTMEKSIQSFTVLSNNCETTNNPYCSTSRRPLVDRPCTPNQH